MSEINDQRSYIVQEENQNCDPYMIDFTSELDEIEVQPYNQNGGISIMNKDVDDIQLNCKIIYCYSFDSNQHQHDFQSEEYSQISCQVQNEEDDQISTEISDKHRIFKRKINNKNEIPRYLNDKQSYIVQEENQNCDPYMIDFTSKLDEIEVQPQNNNGGISFMTKDVDDINQNSKIIYFYSFDSNQHYESNEIQLINSSLSSQLSTSPQKNESDNQISNHQNKKQNPNHNKQVKSSKKISKSSRKKKYPNPTQNLPGLVKRFIIQLAKHDDEWHSTHGCAIDLEAKKKKNNSLSDINTLLSIEQLKDRFIQSLENNEFLLHILNSDKLLDVRACIKAIHGIVKFQTVGKQKKKQSI